MNNLLFNEAWDAIELYADAKADGSLSNDVTRVNLEIGVEDALSALVNYVKPTNES